MNNALRYSLPAAAFLLLFVGSASGRDVTADEKEALGHRADAFLTAVNGVDTEVTVDMIPPRILSAMADQAGLTFVQARAELVAIVDMVMGELEANAEFSFELDVAATHFLELSDGTPYGLIPSRTFIEMEGVAVKVTSEALAVLDEGLWYFVRVDELEQILLLQQVYPLFAGVQFNGPVTEVIEP